MAMTTVLVAAVPIDVVPRHEKLSSNSSGKKPISSRSWSIGF
jgi:hypothetical protein